MLVLYTALYLSITITIHNISYEETQKRNVPAKAGYVVVKSGKYERTCIIQSLGKNNVVEPELLPKKGLKQ